MITNIWLWQPNIFSSPCAGEDKQQIRNNSELLSTSDMEILELHCWLWANKHSGKAFPRTTRLLRTRGEAAADRYRRLPTSKMTQNKITNQTYKKSWLFVLLSHAAMDAKQTTRVSQVGEVFSSASPSTCTACPSCTTFRRFLSHGVVCCWETESFLLWVTFQSQHLTM